MKIVLDIPDNFDDDVKDKFQEFFHRVYEDIANEHSIMCGNYERETVKMFLDSFNNATYLKRDMTNGDMIKAMFPSCKELEILGDGSISCIAVEIGMGTSYFSNHWWNSPYKKEV